MRLRILSWNIHKCIGGVDRRYDPDRIAEVIAHYDPDVALLQEVALNARSRGEAQHELLADRLGLRHVTFFVNVTKRSGERYGNAILSRHSLSDTSNIDLTIPPKKRRSVLHARYRVRLAGRTRTLHVFNLHLGLSGIERKLQLRRFLECHPFAHLHHRTPVVVGGDFNDVWGTLGRKLLEPAGFTGLPRPPRTFPAWAPIRALDALYVRGDLHILRAGAARLALARAASDHLPLIADVELSDRTPLRPAHGRP